MTIQWGLADPSRTGYDALETLRAFDAGAKQKADRERAERAIQANQQVAQQYGAGDLKAATQTAIASGDMDLVRHMASLRADERTRAGEQAELLARSARHLRSVPLEGRESEMQRLLPMFARAGFGAHELEGVDLNDEALAGYEAFGTSIKDALGHELLQTRIADVGVDNQRADRLADDRVRNTDSVIDDRDGRRALTARGQDLGDARGRYGIERASEDRRRGQDVSSTDRQRGQNMAGQRGQARVRPGKGPPRVPGTQDNPAILTSPADVRYLPSGTYFKDPAGNLRRKP